MIDWQKMHHDSGACTGSAGRRYTVFTSRFLWRHSMQKPFWPMFNDALPGMVKRCRDSIASRHHYIGMMEKQQ